MRLICEVRLSLLPDDTNPVEGSRTAECSKDVAVGVRQMSKLGQAEAESSSPVVSFQRRRIADTGD